MATTDGPATVRGVKRSVYAMATGAQDIAASTAGGAGTPALMMDVSKAMSVWLVNVRVFTRDCQDCAEIVTERKLKLGPVLGRSPDRQPGRRGSGHDQDRAMGELNQRYAKFGHVQAGFRGGKIRPGRPSGSEATQTVQRGAGQHGLPYRLRLGRRFKSFRDPDPAGPQWGLRLVQWRRQLGEVNRPRSRRRS